MRRSTIDRASNTAASASIRCRSASLWQQLVLPRIATDGVLWAPHGTLPLALRIPSVATLHDFSSLTMPFRHRAKTVLSFNLFIGRSLQMATRIAAVSRAVAEEAVRWFGVSRARIEIVPNGVDEFFSPATATKTTTSSSSARSSRAKGSTICWRCGIRCRSRGRGSSSAATQDGAMCSCRATPR